MDSAAYFLSLYIISYLENDDLILYLPQVRQTTMVWLYLTVSRLKELLAQVDLKKTRNFLQTAIYVCVYVIGHSPVGLFRTNANRQ